VLRQIAKKVPDDFDDLPEEEQQKIIAALEEVVASFDPAALREEILQLGKLIDQAQTLERRKVESKLVKLKEVITDQGIFRDPKTKLLIFTEHKETLDYLIGKLREWGLSVTQIHGGMKIGDRDQAGTRLFAEKEFRDEVQLLVPFLAAISPVPHIPSRSSDEPFRTMNTERDETLSVKRFPEGDVGLPLPYFRQSLLVDIAEYQSLVRPIYMVAPIGSL